MNSSVNLEIADLAVVHWEQGCFLLLQRLNQSSTPMNNLERQQVLVFAEIWGSNPN